MTNGTPEVILINIVSFSLYIEMSVKYASYVFPASNREEVTFVSRMNSTLQFNV